MEAHFTYIYVFEADNIYKNPPPNAISPIFFCYFFALRLHPRLCWLLERSHIPSFPRHFQTCARLMPGWVASVGCPPPNKNPGYSGGSASRLLSWSFLSHVAVCILNAHSANTIHTICAVFIEYSEPTLYIFWKQLFAISTYMSCDFAHSMVSMWCNSGNLMAFDRWYLEWHMYNISSTWMHLLKLNIVATNFACNFLETCFLVIY